MPDRLIPPSDTARVAEIEDHVEQPPGSTTAVMGEDDATGDARKAGENRKGAWRKEESRDLIEMLTAGEGFAPEVFDLIAREKFHNTRFVRSPDLLTPHISLLCDHPHIITSSKLPDLDVLTIENLKTICDRQWNAFPDARCHPYLPRYPPFGLCSLHQVARGVGGQPRWSEEARAAGL